LAGLNTLLKNAACNAECRMQNSKCKTTNDAPKSRRLHSEFCILHSGCWLFQQPVMRRRLWAFTIAVVIAGAPAVTTICQIVCRSHEMDHSAHSSHQHSDSASARAVDIAASPEGHGCDDPVDGVLAIQRPLQSPIAPAVAAGPAPAFQPPAALALITRPAAIQQSPPGILALTTQLRV
jgi:hypothetical protein